VEIHPYNDPRVIAGQGTAALELLEEFDNLDIVIAPVGGGGLLSGTAISVTAMAPRVKVMAGEPAVADDAYRSLQAGRIIPSVNPATVADGLRTSLGPNTFAIIRRRVERILRVEEDAIVAATRLVWERMKILIEPSSAVPLAAVLGNPDIFYGRRVGVILSGGNADLDRLAWQGGE
jgi:threonine dehydratase